MTTPVTVARRHFLKTGAALAGSLVIDLAIPLAELPVLAQTATSPFVPNAARFCTRPARGDSRTASWSISRPRCRFRRETR